MFSKREVARKTGAFIANVRRLDSRGHDVTYISRTMLGPEELVRLVLASGAAPTDTEKAG